ncbi:MAG: molybdopterin-dependent oxidoreductase, partial [Acidobacteriota bacterium]
LQDARVDHGARMVTFEVRPSATASVSDEYYPIMPGTDGAVAAAMGHVILEEGLHNQDFWDRWANVPLDDIRAQLAPYTPEWAEGESGIPAADIRRIAIEFARAAPACCTMSNRGSAKHYNGVQADRLIRLLDVLVGNVGKPGGFCLSTLRMWTGHYGQDGLPKISQPGPKVPKPKPFLPDTEAFAELPEDVQARVAAYPEKWQKKYFGELATPSEYPLSFHWYTMRVGQLVHEYIKQGRAKVELYMSYTYGASYGYPEANLTREVMLDEDLVPFHVAIEIAYSEHAALADMILPDATSLERWDAHSQNSYDLVPYTGIRQPLVEPLGEARPVQEILKALAQRIGGGMEQYFDFDDMEGFYREWYQNVPISWEELKRRGVWHDADRPKDYELYERPVPADELAGSSTNRSTGVITKDGKAIGIRMDGKAVRGFPTPTRKIQVSDPIFQEAAQAVGLPLDDPNASTLPVYFQVPGHGELGDDEFILTTFKWNVHTQGRSGHLKYQAEIVHTNPVFMHPKTGDALGFAEGDEIEVTTYRPKGYTYRSGEEEPVGSFRNRVRFLKGMHPRVLASAHHVGHWEHGKVGKADASPEPDDFPGYDKDLDAVKDPDLPGGIWWAKSNGGPGGGVHIND